MGVERENAAPALADSALGKGFVSWFRQKCKVRGSIERLILLTYTLIPDVVGYRYHAPRANEEKSPTSFTILNIFTLLLPSNNGNMS